MAAFPNWSPSIDVFWVHACYKMVRMCHQKHAHTSYDLSTSCTGHNLSSKNRLLCFLLTETWNNIFSMSAAKATFPGLDLMRLSVIWLVCSGPTRSSVDRPTHILRTAVKYYTDFIVFCRINRYSIWYFCITPQNYFIHEVFIVTEILFIFLELLF